MTKGIFLILTVVSLFFYGCSSSDFAGGAGKKTTIGLNGDGTPVGARGANDGADGAFGGEGENNDADQVDGGGSAGSGSANGGGSANGSGSASGGGSANGSGSAGGSGSGNGGGDGPGGIDSNGGNGSRDGDGLEIGDSGSSSTRRPLLLKQHSGADEKGTIRVRNEDDRSWKEASFGEGQGKEVELSGVCYRSGLTIIEVEFHGKDVYHPGAENIRKTRHGDESIEVVVDMDGCGFLGTCVDPGKDNTYTFTCENGELEIDGL